MCVVSPSEVSSGREFSQLYRQRRWWLDSCHFGDVLDVTWNGWAHFNKPLAIPPHSAEDSCLRDLYLAHDSNIAAPTAPTRRRPLERSAGAEIPTPLPGNRIPLTGCSQLPRLSLRQVRANSAGWPQRPNREDNSPSLREKVTMLGGRKDVEAEKLVGAYWRSLPRLFTNFLLAHLLSFRTGSRSSANESEPPHEEDSTRG